MNFTKYFHLGVPVEDPPKEGEEDVLILHGTRMTVPKSISKIASDQITHESGIPLLPVDKALERCEEVHIVLTDNTMRRKCVALVPQYESFHIFKYMRVPEKGGKVNKTEKLRYVSRGYQTNGRDQFIPPAPNHTRRLWNMLVKYIQSINEVLAALEKQCKKVIKDNTLIVMVCNFGQSELLLNFVCSARARGLDTSQILVFATDKETKSLAEGLGLTAFFDEKNFGPMPSEAANGYGDRKFVAMMLAKVLCVQMVSMLGYDFLFQDVDIIWFKHPLDYFKQQKEEFDIYFQDDGAHSTRYAPYSANTGFYFVKHNARTQFFLTSLLHAGDLVIKTDSHQQALIALLAEHVSLYGLRVKVLDRHMEEFPGGYNYHQKSGKYMKAFFQGEIKPYIFHMSWTLNKNNKLLFLKQMGEWYLKDKCIQTKAEDIGTGDLAPTCCLAEPNVTCHYRDKPSKIPCTDFPPIDVGKDSFW